MIGYVTLGTNDLPRATRFYDALLAEIGGKRTMEFDGFIVWSTSAQAPALAVTRPYNRQAATVGNGVMVALAAGSKANVDALHARALALGGTDEGKPGPRGEGFYAAYFRDLDGNKLNAFVMGRAAA